MLINNAGYGSEGPIEEVPMAEVRRQFETNVFGLARLTKLVLPGMRKQGWGRVVNLSSMGGRMTFPGGGFYHATKYAVEAISDALRFEVQGFGIDVIVIEPGPIKTEFAETAIGWVARTAARMPGTTRPSERRRRGRTRGPSRGGSAAGRTRSRRRSNRDVRARPRTRYRVTASARLFLTLRRLLPDRGMGRARRPDLAEAVGAGEALGEQLTSNAAGRPTT